MVIYKIILLIINLCLFSTKIQERCKIPDAFCRGNWGNANIWVSLQKYIIAAALCWCLQETQMWTMGVKRKRAFPYLWHPGMDNAHLWTLPLFFTPVKFPVMVVILSRWQRKGHTDMQTLGWQNIQNRFCGSSCWDTFYTDSQGEDITSRRCHNCWLCCSAAFQ